MSKRPGIRNRPREKFVIIRNAAMQDPNLSLKAKGLLGVMLSFPDDWVYYMDHLEAQSTDGRDSTRSGMAELLKAGYVTRRRARGDKGTFTGYEYEVADYRQGNDDTGDDKTENEPAADRSPTLSPQSASRGTKQSRVGQRSHRSTGNPSAGKAVSRENRQPGKPSDGKPEAIKNESIKTKNIKKESSRSAPTSNAPTSSAPTTTTSGGKERSLAPRIITALGRKFLSTLFEEDSRRSHAWPELTAKQQEAAFRKAQERSKQPTEQRAFSTLLKDELDETAGLNVASTTAPHTISPERAQLIESAKQAQEEAYHAALDAGLDSYEAELAGTRAYREALESGHSVPNMSAPAGELDHQQDAQTAQGPAEPQTAFAFARQHLSYQEWTGGNMKQAGKLAALTPEQDQAALQRAMERSSDDLDTHAFALLVLEELRREAGLNPTKRPNAQNTPNASDQ